MSQMSKPQLLCSIPEEATVEHNCSHCSSFVLMTKSVCRKCVQPAEHMQHVVYGLQEAAKCYRKLLQEILVILSGKLKAAKSSLAKREWQWFRKGEELRFKQMIRAEYMMRFWLLTEQIELPCLKPPACKFDPDLKKKKLMRTSWGSWVLSSSTSPRKCYRDLARGERTWANGRWVKSALISTCAASRRPSRSWRSMGNLP